MARKAYSARERERVREALLTTVLQCIVDRGLIHSSIEVLSKKVGISKSFFYSFFPSKEELVLQALRYQQPKLLRYARELMDDPALSWREGVKTFLHSCCDGAKNGIAVLSMEEEQAIFRCLSKESFQAFRADQLALYEARLFGNLALEMMMVQKAIPDSLPFLFPEAAEAMAEFQIDALADALQRARDL